MIRVFYGDDRIKAKQEIRRLLGDGYEVLDGAELSANDLPSVFFGASLFAEKRSIMITDFTANRAVYDELPKYLDTKHEIILLETKIDKRAATYKELKDRLEFREFKLPDNTNFQVIFDIYRTAKRDGRRAIEMLESVKLNEDPIKFTGLLVSQAIKDFSAHPGTTEKKALKEIAKLDLDMKSTAVDPWLLVESFLLRLKTL